MDSLSVIFCAKNQHMLNCFWQTRKLSISIIELSSGCVMIWNPLIKKKKKESADDVPDYCACAAQFAYALLCKSVVTRVSLHVSPPLGWVLSSSRPYRGMFRSETFILREIIKSWGSLRVNVIACISSVLVTLGWWLWWWSASMSRAGPECHNSCL